jgi:aerobic-type carbon monoxide dehydrogenase small subunit (CoxS/CutS family)
VSRRSFIKTMGVSAAAGSLAAAAQASGVLGRRDQDAGVPILGPDAVGISLTVNGKAMPLEVEPATTLLEALRIHLGLTGAKEVCDRGACGACSVIVDGKLVNSCMTLAVDCVGSQITTVEGIGTPEAMDPLQTAFVKHDAMQCGYCTPGFVVACRAFLDKNPKPTLEQIKHGLGGNICRCGTYTNIFNAVLEASGQSPVMEQKAS